MDQMGMFCFGDRVIILFPRFGVTTEVCFNVM